MVAASVHDRGYPAGVVILLIAGACLSLSGLILRNMEAADGWQILFYRSLGFMATLLVYFAFRYGRGTVRAFRDIGKPGLLIALFLTFGSTAYLFALILTKVADVMFILSVTPFFAAVFAWIILGERVARSTWIAIAAAIAGMSLMFAEGVTGGALLGRALAFVPVMTLVGMVIVMRKSHAVDMGPAACAAGVPLCLVSAFMADGLAISDHDLVLSLLMGSVQFGLGFLLLTIGSRRVPAAQVSLFILTEPILAPIWVWVFVDEVPGNFTLLGGAVVLAAVVAQSIHGIRRGRATVQTRGVV